VSSNAYDAYSYIRTGDVKGAARRLLAHGKMILDHSGAVIHVAERSSGPKDRKTRMPLLAWLDRCNKQLEVQARGPGSVDVNATRGESFFQNDIAAVAAVADRGEAPPAYTGEEPATTGDDGDASTSCNAAATD
jgi:hypothetical protein